MDAIKQCTDKNIIKKILQHQDVRGWLTDDNSPVDHEPVIHPSIIYLVDETENGVIRIDPMNGISCFVHIATTPKMWGAGHEFVKDAIKWGFENTPYLKVVAFIPVFNEHTVKLVKDVGFKQEGICRKSFLKNWVLHDQLIFGLCKGEI